MSESLSLAVVGAGSWGRNLIRNIASVRRASLRYICDCDEKTALAEASHYPGVRGLADIEQVLSDPEIQAVVIATDAVTHYPLATRVLESGRHVFVEKPMTLSSADATRLVELARRVNRKLMVGHLLEHHPAVHAIRDMILSGSLGQIYYMYTQRINLGVVRSNENAWWSLAPHDISVVCRLFDATPVQVSAQGQSYLQNKIEDVVFSTLKFSDGRLAHIHVSWLDPHKIRKMTIVGTQKMVTFDDMSGNDKIWIYDKGASKGPSRIDNFADMVNLRWGDIVIPHMPGGEPLALECRHFVDAVLDDKPILTDGDDGLRVVKILEAGQRSLEYGGSPVLIGH